MTLPDTTDIVNVVTGIVTAASIVANFVAPWTWVGKVANWIALNGPTVQRAAEAADAARKAAEAAKNGKK